VKLLLDTHIFLWSLLDPERLGRRAAMELENTSNELWLSPISLWEVLILAERGRVTLQPDPVRWLHTVLAAVAFHEAPLNREVAIQSRLVALPHQDPVDRFLAATALVYDLTLVTADDRLLKSQRVPTLASTIRE
jgi:PIN domain nuclease of toxin-antitoxin system